MTIDEAIKWLQSAIPTGGPLENNHFQEACHLGIEALKSVRTGRKVGLHYEAKRLLGETEE